MKPKYHPLSAKQQKLCFLDQVFSYQYLDALLVSKVYQLLKRTQFSLKSMKEFEISNMLD